jgi:hypothetical protein
MLKKIIFLLLFIQLINLNAQVGIGTSSPAEILDIVSSDAVRTAVRINNDSTGDPMVKFAIADSTYFSMGIDNDDSDKFKIGTFGLVNNTRLTITSAGLVGVGISTPGYRLEVNGDFNLSNSTDEFNIGGVHILSKPFSQNLFVGEGAGSAILSGGSDNVFLGYNAGLANTNADRNVLIGSEAGTAITTGGNNTIIGYQAGSTLATGTANVFIGYQAGASETGSNKLYIANSNTTTPLIYGDFSTSALTFNGSVEVNGQGGDFDFTVQTENLTHALFVDASTDQILVGGSTPITVGGVNAQFQVTGEATQTGFSLVRHADNSSSPHLYFAKARGTSAAPTIVQSGDVLGDFVFYGYDGTDYGTAGAKIEVLVDGTPGVGDMPGQINFQTSADGAGILSTRMTIKESGRIGVNVTDPSSTFEVNGSFARPVTNTTTDLTLTESHSIITANTTSGTITITLPAATDADNRTYTLIKTNASNSLIIDGDGAETINGNVDLTYTNLYSRVTIISDGTSWYILEETTAP